MENFFEKYELLDLVKDCESTKIYKARNNFDGNVVYIYLLVDDCCSEFINDVYDNLEMYKNINNENIMKVYDTGKCYIDGVNHYFIEKEYVEGKSLDDILEDLGRLDVDKALIIARHILDGLNYFYKNKSCDGNLRPRNIFVGTDSEVKLDLLVYPKHDERDLGYTSPEQAIVNYITIYDDMYSLGTILFRMITGRLPFGEFESREDVFKVVSGGLYFKEEDGLDDQLRYLFVKSLQARPLDRYFDLEEFMVDIDEYLKNMEEDRKCGVIIDEAENDEEVEEEVEVDGDDEDYGSEKGTKRLKVMVGVLSVAVCVVGVASFTFIKDMMGGSESHDDSTSQEEPVINIDDSEDEEEQNQDAPTVDNNEEEVNTNEKETNQGESKTQEETNHGENITNSGNKTNNNHNNNQNNNQNNNGNNNNSNNNNSQNKPEDGSQNSGNNNGGNNGSNNDGTVPPENNNGAEDGNIEKPNNPDDGSNSGNNENPPADNPDDSNNTEGQQPQADPNYDQQLQD